MSDASHGMKQWQKIVLAVFITVVVVTPVSFFLGAIVQKQITAQQAAQVTNLNADTIFNLVNAERTKAGLKPLVRDARLDATAQAKADEMIAKGYFGHYDPMTGKNSAWDNPLFNELCSASSENISKVDDIGEKNADTVNGWMNSKPHHDAILRDDYTLTGVAVHGDVAVQHFCVSK